MASKESMNRKKVKGNKNNKKQVCIMKEILNLRSRKEVHVHI